MYIDSPNCIALNKSVRPVFYQTEYEDFLYATDGGTLFLVRYRGKVYGLTCKHVFTGGGFEANRLFVVQEKMAQKGSLPAAVKGLYYPSSPKDAALDTDITDLCVIEFDEEAQPNFFGDAPYNLDKWPASTGLFGHPLVVCGVLKEVTTILPPDISIGYCRLDYLDVTKNSSDPILREGCR